MLFSEFQARLRFSKGYLEGLLTPAPQDSVWQCDSLDYWVTSQTLGANQLPALGHFNVFPILSQILGGLNGLGRFPKNS